MGDLKFSDVPGGALDSYAAVPALGWLQIVGFIIFLELAYGATPEGNEPGDVGGVSWIRYSDPEVKKFKLNAERNNGRAAMMGITGIWSTTPLASTRFSQSCSRQPERGSPTMRHILFSLTHASL